MARPVRPGFTLLEMICVLVLVIILGAATVPSVTGLYGNTHQRAAADVVATRLADARGKAMETGNPYRLAVNGQKVRVAPDGPEFAALTPDDPPALLSQVTEDTLDKATAAVTGNGVSGATTGTADVPPPGPDQSGWTTVAVYLPDGTCRDAAVVVVEVRDHEKAAVPPIRIQVRGVTGGSRVLPQAAGAGP